MGSSAVQRFASTMEGAHGAGRVLKDVVVGSKAEAAAGRERAQQGAAAAARRGQAVLLARARKATGVECDEKDAISKEVARAMKQGNALVQAAVEHVETAERSWDRFVELGGHVIKRYPTEVQVVTYMSKCPASGNGCVLLSAASAERVCRRTP